MSQPPLIEIRIVSCPLDDCQFMLDATPPQVPDSALASVFGPGVMAAAAVARHHAEIERQLQEHFTDHATVDYLRTIARHRAEIERLTAEARRSAAQGELDGGGPR